MPSKEFAFQKLLVKKTYQDMMDKSIVVLAACPGAGKTVMAINIIDRYLEQFPDARVLILCHGQALLRTQWHERVHKFMVNRSFAVWERGVDPKHMVHKVTLAIPQSIWQAKEIPNYDLVVVDEAHQFYLAGIASDLDEGVGMVQKIIGESKPRHQLLLTGSPSRLIKAGYQCHGITMSELLETGRLTDVDMELGQIKAPLSLLDYYKGSMEVSSGHAFSDEEIADTMDSLLIPLRRWVARALGVKVTDWPSAAAAIKKTMVACYSIQEANSVHAYLEGKGVTSLVSTSETEEFCTDTIHNFKKNPKVTVLIVVRRGILGFDFPELTCMLDFTASLNVDRVFQLISRLVRKSEKEPGRRKLFFKLTSDTLSAPTYHVMSYVCALSVPEFYYLPTDYQTFKIPVRKEFLDVVNEHTKVRAKKPPRLQDLPALMSFREVPKRGEKVDVFARTSFKSVRDKLFRKCVIHDEESAREEAMSIATYTEFRKSAAYRYFAGRKALMSVADIFPQIVKHLNNMIPKTFTIEEMTAAMKSVNNRYELKVQHLVIYKYALRHHRDLLDEFLPKTVWTTEKAEEVLKKAFNDGIRSRSVFHRTYQGCDDYISRTNQRDLMDKYWPVIHWNKGTALGCARAAKATGMTQKEFVRTNRDAYDYLASVKSLHHLDAIFDGTPEPAFRDRFAESLGVNEKKERKPREQKQPMPPPKKTTVIRRPVHA